MFEKEYKRYAKGTAEYNEKRREYYAMQHAKDSRNYYYRNRAMILEQKKGEYGYRRTAKIFREMLA